MTPSPLRRFAFPAFTPGVAVLLLFLFRTHPSLIPIRCATMARLSLFSSYRPPVQLSSYLPHAFWAYLVFRGPAKTAKSKSMAFILIVSLIYWSILYLQRHLPLFVQYNAILRRFLSVTLLLQLGASAYILASLRFQRSVNPLNLLTVAFCQGGLLTLIFSLHALLLLLFASAASMAGDAFASLLASLLLLVFVYYFPRMPNFFLSFSPTLRRTMAALLLFFLVLTPQFVIILRMVAAYVLCVILPPQTQAKGINFLVREIRKYVSIEYSDATWIVDRFSWSIASLFLLCNVAKVYIH